MRRSRKAKKTSGSDWGDLPRRQRRTTKPKGAESSINDAEAEICDDERGRKFFGCYLLTSLSPRYKGHTYIGFTVNPKRRIRQHNGEITSGASHTKMKRPWEMVLCIHGFPTNVAALKFEWAWQHPKESLAVKEAAATFKTLGGLANRIKLALTMLTLPSWKSMDLTVSFFSTKYMTHTAGCPSLPPQMKLHFCSMDELPCYCDVDNPNADYGLDHEDDVDSHHGEDFCDDRQLSSIDDLGLCSRSALDIQSRTRENTSEDIWPTDPRGIHGLHERGSSSMAGNATLEECMQPFHQVPSDFQGSASDSTNGQVQLCEETWHNRLRDSFSTSEEPLELLRSFDDPSNEESPPFPMVEKHVQRFQQFPVGGHRCARNNINDLLLEGHIEPFHLVDPFGGELSPVVRQVPITNKFGEDNKTHVMVAESSKEQRQRTDEQSPNGVTYAIQPSTTEGIEVIDLFTPSPDCRVVACSKKRRVVCDSADIIDLTRSPVFVQL